MPISGLTSNMLPQTPRFQGTHYIHREAMSKDGYDAYGQAIRLGQENGHFRAFFQDQDWDVIEIDPGSKLFEADFSALIQANLSFQPKAHQAKAYFSDNKQGQTLNACDAVIARLNKGLASVLPQLTAKRIEQNKAESLARGAMMKRIFSDRDGLLEAYQSDPEGFSKAFIRFLNSSNGSHVLRSQPDVLEALWQYVRQKMPALGLKWLFEVPDLQMGGGPSCFMGGPDSLAFREQLRQANLEDLINPRKFDLKTGKPQR